MHNSELSIAELSGIVIRRYRAVVVVSFLFAVGALGYSLLSSPIYRAETHILPPPQSSLEYVTVGFQELYSNPRDLKRVTPEKVYQSFVGKLNSRTFQRHFMAQLRSGELPLPVGSVLTQINNHPTSDALPMRVNINTVGKTTREVRVSLEYWDAEVAAALVNAYVEYADRQTVAEFAENNRSLIHSKVRLLELAVAASKKGIERRREEEIRRLDEALVIAKRIRSTAGDNVGGGPQPTFVITASAPRYLRGIDALEAEIQVLRSGGFMGLPTDEFHRLQEELELFAHLQPGADRASAMTIAEVASPSGSPANASALVMLLLGGFAGLIVGVVAVLAIDLGAGSPPGRS